MHIKLCKILNDSYYFLYDDELQIGKCIIIKRYNTITLKYITIYEKYRGNNYSTIFWNLLENEFTSQNVEHIIIEAHESNQKYNKLYELYSSWGFEQNGVIKYVNNGEEVERVIPMIKKLT